MAAALLQAGGGGVCHPRRGRGRTIGLAGRLPAGAGGFRDRVRPPRRAFQLPLILVTASLPPRLPVLTGLAGLRFGGGAEDMAAAGWARFQQAQRSAARRGQGRAHMATRAASLAAWSRFGPVVPPQ